MGASPHGDGGSRQVVERLGEPDGIIAFDPSSFPKRGPPSVGVKRQWCGHRGKGDNCQGGVCLGSVSCHDHALLDFRLSLPAEWARDEARRPECHVPPAVRYPPRPEPCLAMREAWGNQVPHGWVTGDDELGRHARFRHALRERGERYGLGVPCNTTLRALEAPWPTYHGRGRRPKAPWQSVTQWRQGRDAQPWAHLTGRDGAKGPVDIEMVRRRVQPRIERKRPGPEAWLVITRPPLADDRTLGPRASRAATDQDARHRYQSSLTPAGGSEAARKAPSLGELARVIKAGACIAASVKRGKGEGGMDEYQVRTWHGWHHHMRSSLMAVWFLIGAPPRGQSLPPALTLPQGRDGMSLLLLAVCCPLGVDDICRQVQRQ